MKVFMAPRANQAPPDNGRLFNLVFEIFRKLFWGAEALLGIARSASRNNIIFCESTPTANRDFMFLMQNKAILPAVKTPVVVFNKNFLPFNFSQCGWKLIFAGMAYSVVMVHFFFMASHPLPVIGLEFVFILLVVSLAIFPFPGFSLIGLIAAKIRFSIPFNVIRSSDFFFSRNICSMFFIPFCSIANWAKTLNQINGYPIATRTNRRGLPQFLSRMTLPTKIFRSLTYFFSAMFAMVHINLPKIGYTMIIPYVYNRCIP